MRRSGKKTIINNAQYKGSCTCFAWKSHLLLHFSLTNVGIKEKLDFAKKPLREIKPKKQEVIEKDEVRVGVGGEVNLQENLPKQDEQWSQLYAIHLYSNTSGKIFYTHII